MYFYKGQILTQPYDISNIHGFYIHFFNLKVRPVFSFIHLLESQGFIAFLDLQVVWVFIFFFFFQLERCYLRNTTRCLGNGYSCSPTPWFFSQQSRSLFLKLIFKFKIELSVYWLYSWCSKLELVKYMHWNGNCLL